MKPRRRAAKIAALVIYIIVVLVATPQAQQPVAFAGSPGAMAGGPPATVPPDATERRPAGRPLDDPQRRLCRSRACR